MKKIAIVLLVLVASLAACRKGAVIVNYDEPINSLSHEVTMQEVRKSILEGCSNAKWSAMDIAEGVIEARLIVRAKHTVVVEIRYDTKKFSIYYKDSINMNYKENKIHPNYNKWVANLEKAVGMSLSRSMN